MFRSMFGLLCLASATYSFNALRAEDPATLEANKEFKGSLPDQKYVNNLPGRPGDMPYGQEIPIKLKDGQKISISASVSGSGRYVMLFLLDPTGKTVASKTWEKMKTTLDYPSANATGEYKIVVLSDQIGGFIIVPKFDSDKVVNAKELEAKIARLKKELAESEAQLKALQEKK